MQKKVTIGDVASESGVNVSTVSRALAGLQGVHKDTRERVIGVAERLGYRPNRLARSLVTGRSHTFALIVNDIRNPFFAEVARGAEDAARAAGFALILCNTDLENARQMEYVESLLEKRVDGILMNSVWEVTKDQQQRLKSCGVPIVLLNPASSRGPFSTVYADNEQGGVLAAQYLRKLGHRRIALISGPRGHRNLSARVAGFTRELPGEPVILHGANTCAAAMEMTRKLLASHPKVTAVFAVNDIMAFGVMRELMRAGRRIPEDVSVIGFDDIELASVMHPALTTIHQPTYEIGKAAIEILLRMAGRKDAVPEQRLFGVSLIQRESCQKLR